MANPGLIEAHGNALLNVYRGTTFTGITVYIQLHKGAPGAAGTSNVSAVTTRYAATFAAPSGCAMSLSTPPTSWSMTATEDIDHITWWTASSGGSCLRSVALTSTKHVISGDTFQLTQLDVSFTPQAA